MKRPVWGITGGIASGKSTFSRFLTEAGAGFGLTVVDADRLARELSSPGGAAHAAIEARFGTSERGKLRQLVFSDPRARRDLEAILHPLIQAESRRRLEAVPASPNAPFFPVFYEATLLVETGRAGEFAGLLVVEAPLAARREWLRARDAMDDDAIDRVLAAQADDAQRRAAATEVILNSGSPADLRAAAAGFLSRHGWD